MYHICTNGITFLNDLNETWYVMVFGVAESEFDIRIVKFNMADSKWPTQNSCQMLKYYRDLEKLYIEVFEVAESENLALEFLISIWPTQNGCQI